MKRPKNIAIVLAAVLVIVVALQNTESVETDVLFFTLSAPRVVLLTLTFLVGAVVGFVFGARSSGKGTAGAEG